MAIIISSINVCKPHLVGIDTDFLNHLNFIDCVVNIFKYIKQKVNVNNANSIVIIISQYICVYQIITLCTLNIHNCICALFVS